MSRTGSDKSNNTGRIYIAKNRNGIDGVVFPIFMDPGNVEIKVFAQTEMSAESEDNGPRKVYRLMKEEQRTKQTTKGE